MQFAFILFTIIAGVASALQAGSNNTLQKALQAPWFVVFTVPVFTFIGGLIAALVAIPLSGERLPSVSSIAAVPWYGWLGGLLGLGFVLASVFASPKLGGGLFIALFVTASILTSLALDHWGLMGFEVHRLGWGRLLGAVAMISGLVLIARF